MLELIIYENHRLYIKKGHNTDLKSEAKAEGSESLQFFNSQRAVWKKTEKNPLPPPLETGRLTPTPVSPRQM